VKENNEQQTAKRVLVVEDDPQLRDAIVSTLELANSNVFEVASAEEACVFLSNNDVDLVFSDVCMHEMDGHDLLRWINKHKPQIPFILMTAYGTIERSVEAMRDGAADYITKPFEPVVLLSLLEQYAGSSASPNEPIVCDEKTKAIYHIAKRVAQTDSTVLIAGESGSGKEVLAQYIHQQSSRNTAPFIAINCAAIPETMLEATLFGHEKGAFTGAYNAAPGKFEQANGGTLLLDEVSEMDLGLQAKLLRVLQEREVERVGGRKVIPLDVRVIATTNRNLRQYVESGNFREDLFYRLSVFPLTLPTLKERPDDIAVLADYLLAKHAKRMHKQGVSFNASALEKLIGYHWPGNVRELDNVVQRALILSLGQQVGAEDLLFDEALPLTEQINVEETLSPDDKHAELESIGELNHDLKRHELEKIQQALIQSKGSKKDAAELLGLSPRTLRYKMAKFREAGLLVE